MKRLLPLALPLLTALAGTVSAKALPPEPPDTHAVVWGNKDFGFDLYRELAREREGKNLFFSPYSIAEALAVPYAGARGGTEKEMAKALRFWPRQERRDQEELHKAFRKLTYTHHNHNYHRDGFIYELVTANATWVQKGFAFQPAYLKLLKGNYAGALREVDFAGGHEQARRTINDAVQKQTKDRVKGLLPRGIIDDDTRLVLTNAVTFRSGWESAFDEKASRKADFHVSKDKKVSARMMSQEGVFGYYRGKGFQMLRLPYRDGRMGMLVFLPDEGEKLADFEKRLTADALNLWWGGQRRTRLHVSLPRFELAGEFRLDESLRAMGIRKAFKSGEADFSGVGKGNLFISAVMHEAKIKVDEQGTEATGVKGKPVEGDSKPLRFTADRPFVFLVYPPQTSSALFLGRVVEPK